MQMGGQQCCIRVAVKKRGLALLRLLFQPEDRWQEKKASEQRWLSVMALLNRCIVYLLKNGSNLSRACPHYPFDLLEPFSSLFSITPTEPHLMATV